MAIAGKYSFSLQRGSSEARLFRTYGAGGQPVVSSGHSVRMQIRTLAGATGPTTAETLVMDIPQGQGIDFTNNPESPGEILLLLTPQQTQALSPDNQRVRLSYGIELFTAADAEVVPVLQGFITVLPEVVR